MDRRILIIDSEKKDIDILKYYIKENSSNVSIYYATSGRNGLAAAVKYKPHLIFIDFNLPDIEGFKLCQKIKTDDRINEARVIFLTHMAEDINRAYNNGAEDYIIKHPSPFFLMEKINTHLYAS
ncbi:MAG: response regulator [Pseudomonadota bacterium]